MSQSPGPKKLGKIDPNLVSTTRLATPPLKGRSLLSVGEDGEIAPHFSLLLHPDADVDEFQDHIENNHKSPSGSGSRSPTSPPPQLFSNIPSGPYSSLPTTTTSTGPGLDDSMPDTSDPEIGKVISKDTLAIPDTSGVVLPPTLLTDSPEQSTFDFSSSDLTTSFASTLSPRYSSQQGRIKDKTTQDINPATLQAARQAGSCTPQDVAAALNLKIVDKIDDDGNVVGEDGKVQGEGGEKKTLNGLGLDYYQQPVTIRGICKAQSLVRGYLARTRARKDLMMQAWKELDTKEEQELSLNNNQFNDLKNLVDNDTLMTQLQQHQLTGQTSGSGGAGLALSTGSGSNVPLGSPLLSGMLSEASPLTKAISESPIVKAMQDGMAPIDDLIITDVVEKESTKEQSLLSPHHESPSSPQGDFSTPQQSPEQKPIDPLLKTPLVSSTSVQSPPPSPQQQSPSPQLLQSPSSPHLRLETETTGPIIINDQNIGSPGDEMASLARTPLEVVVGGGVGQGDEQEQEEKPHQQQGLYIPASGLSFGDDDARVSLSDLHVPQNALVRSSSLYESDDNNQDWVENLQTRMKQLRLLREFREHAIPHPSSPAAFAGSPDVNIDWSAVDQITKEDQDFFYQQVPHFRSRLTDGYKISKSIINRYPRANLSVLTATSPISLEWVHLLKDELASGRIPIAPIVERIILITFSILCKEPNVQDVTVPHNGKVTVVGDIHGQLADLLSIFRLNGVPAASNVYVFNGDWVDRGSQSIECLILLLAWKALYPQYVFLNRGNHEAADINSRDGFERECKEKYGVGIFPLFSELFSAVPIACRIFGSAADAATSENLPPGQKAQQKPAIFVTHGGIPHKGLTIDQIQQENRFFTVPRTNSIIFNMLWSDPSPYKGTYPSSRGAGYEFGPDVTLDFLRSNRCCMLIRSHECVEQGWQLSHHNMCLTVFSASNYQSSVGNQGGYCIIESSLRPTLVTFYAESSNQLATRSSIRFKRLETSVVQKLMDRIAIHRLDLISHYNRVAHDNLERAKRGELAEALNTNAALPCSDQIISRTQWADGLREVLGVNIPFLLFQEQLGLPDRGVLGDERGPINYMAFLTPFTPKNDLFREIDTKTTEELHHIGARPSSAGADKSKKVAKSGVEGVDGEGPIKLTPEVTRAALAQLSQLLFSHRYEVENVFRFLDLDNNGSVTRDEFITGIYNLIVLFRAKVTKMRHENHPDCETYANNASLLLDIDWDRNNLALFADIVDQNADGDINYSEFVTHFQFEAQGFEKQAVDTNNYASALVKK